jgi:hypothetical protein
MKLVLWSKEAKDLFFQGCCKAGIVTFLLLLLALQPVEEL